MCVISASCAPYVRGIHLQNVCTIPSPFHRGRDLRNPIADTEKPSSSILEALGLVINKRNSFSCAFFRPVFLNSLVRTSGTQQCCFKWANDHGIVNGSESIAASLQMCTGVVSLHRSTSEPAFLKSYEVVSGLRPCTTSTALR